MGKFYNCFIVIVCLFFLSENIHGQEIRKGDKYTHARPTIGDEAPEIILKSPEGKTFKLSDLKGNYVLLDFWAAWCAPCRKANRKLVKIYEKYKASGFTIYSVSLDTNTDAWKQAILMDQMPWAYQVCEPEGFKGHYANVYRVDYLPDNYLIDKKGKIIAVDLKTSEIDKILKIYTINR